MRRSSGILFAVAALLAMFITGARCDRLVVEYDSANKQAVIENLVKQGWKVVVDMPAGNAVAVERTRGGPVPLSAQTLVASLPGVLSAKKDKIVYLIDGDDVKDDGLQQKPSIGGPQADLQKAVCVNNNVEKLYTQIDGTEEIMPYGIPRVQATDRVFLTNKTRQNVIYCVLDTGTWGAHPDLSTGENLVTGCNPPDCRFYWSDDMTGHGTHVSGTIAALRNGAGVIGVASNGAHLYVQNVFGQSRSLEESDIVVGWNQCIEYLDAYKNSTNPLAKMVITMSLGGPGPATPSVGLEADALFARGDVLLLAAAGNSGNSELTFPAAYEKIVSIAAVDADNLAANFSQRNADVELTAPGQYVLSTTIESDASFSTPSAPSMLKTYPDILGDRLSKPAPARFFGSTASFASGRLVNCGKATDPCPNSNGAICLIERGENYFCTKVNNCMAAGGVGALIYNNVENSCDSLNSGTLVVNNTVCPLGINYVPTLGLARIQGEALLNSLNSGVQITATIEANMKLPPFAWKSGTSMSTPHAAGVAGLVWGAFPNCTNAEVLAALKESAMKLGDASTYGAGMVQAKAAYDNLRQRSCAAASVVMESSPVPTETIPSPLPFSPPPPRRRRPPPPPRRRPPPPTRRPPPPRRRLPPPPKPVVVVVKSPPPPPKKNKRKPPPPKRNKRKPPPPKKNKRKSPPPAKRVNRIS